MSLKVKKYFVAKKEAGFRLDVFLGEKLGSRSKAARLIKDGAVKIDNKKVTKSSTLISEGQKIEVVEKSSPSKLPAANIPLKIIYEDKDAIVIDKPAGLTVHPGSTRQKDTLVNALLGHLKKLPRGGDALRPGIVHRLDRDTSGTLIVAKNEKALRFLQGEFKERRVEKIYEALVEGTGLPEKGTIDSPLKITSNDKTKMRVRSGRGAKSAVTHFRVMKEFPREGATLLEIRLETGRTHQIRVHMAAISHPVLGDDKYGKRKQNHSWREKYGLKRQFLHARKLGIVLPDGQKKVFETELAGELRQVLAGLDN